MAGIIAKAAYAVFQHGSVIGDNWPTRASAVRICESQSRYARAIGQSADGLCVIQGGYDDETGDKVMRYVYPKRSAWRLV
jgi:hypothetical protein